MKAKTSYTKREIALMYFPKSTPKNAVRCLSVAIRRCKELHDKLSQSGYFLRGQILTPHDVKLIFHFLGEP